ncbi:MAG: hypothetical protein EBT70_03085 [Betaproteobacteria bacterium]|nr:hypothetical protein [Betaproteobacteria bacterium]
MGMMDRDYWRDKYNKNTSQKTASPTVAKFMADMQSQIDSLTQKKRARNRKLLILTLSILLILSTYFMERVGSLEALKTKIQIYLKRNNDSPINTISGIASSKDIIPGILATGQTDFSKQLGVVELEVDLKTAVKNNVRYSIHNDFYYDKDGTNGSIALKIVNVDEKNGTYSGKLNVYMWGAILPITTPISRIDKQICPAKITYSKSEDDKRECEMRLGHNMSTFIKGNISKPLRLKMDFRAKEKMLASYQDESGEYIEIAGFTIPKDAKIKNVITHTLHFTGVISDCLEIQPIEFRIQSIKNDGISGRSSLHKQNSQFSCINNVYSKDASGVITMGTRQQKAEMK